MEAILAHEKDGGIGLNNSLPWGSHNSIDMKHFVNTTTGKTVVMGYKTFESLGCKPLPKRRNIVLSRSEREIEGVEVMTLEDFLSHTSLHDDCVVIGGGIIYNLLLPHCDTVFVTQFRERFECDTFIDRDYFQNNYNQWKLMHRDDAIEIWKYSDIK